MKTKKLGKLIIPNSHIVDGETYAVIITLEVDLKFFS